MNYNKTRPDWKTDEFEALLELTIKCIHKENIRN